MAQFRFFFVGAHAVLSFVCWSEALGINQYVDYDFRIVTNPVTPANPKPAIFVLVRDNKV